MKTLPKSAKRIAELEKAIIDAQSWLQAREGVRLVYYHDDFGDDDSVAVIEKLLKRKARADRWRLNTTGINDPLYFVKMHKLIDSIK